MSKIRINELARQLEVKSREVIDKLHELGIAEKVTHSSSIDEDKADQLRRYYRGESYAPRPITHPNGAGVAVEDHAASKITLPKTALPKTTMKKRRPSPRRRSERAPPLRRVTAPAPPASDDAPKRCAGRGGRASRSGTARRRPREEKTEEDNKPRVMPLRPPMLTRGAPIHPPVGGAESSIARCAAGAAAAVRAASSDCAGTSHAASAAADSNDSGCASSGPGSFGSAPAIAASGRTSSQHRSVRVFRVRQRRPASALQRRLGVRPGTPIAPAPRAPMSPVAAIGEGPRHSRASLSRV